MNLGLAKSEQESTVLDVANGRAYERLHAAQVKQMEFNAQIGAKKLQIDALPDSVEKSRAYELWNAAKSSNEQAYESLRQAVDSYNKVADAIRTVTLGTVAPKSLAGLGLAPLALAAIILASAFAIDALASAYAKVVQGNTQTKALLEQLSELVRAPGESVAAVFTGFAKAGWFLVLLGAGFVGYQIYKDRRGGSRASVPKMLDLKPVTAEVLK